MEALEARHLLSGNGVIGDGTVAEASAEPVINGNNLRLDVGCQPVNELLGDLDGNGVVELADFITLSANFGVDVVGYAQGDIDCNGTIEFADFLALSANFSQTIATASSVPGAASDDVPSTTASNLGDLDLTELLYGDPAEALALIQPPEADVDGGASIAHPLPVPPGRADVQPDLALTYDSNGGSGWVGIGWDLSVGAVTVDTEYGAPRYLSAEESETYLLDGDRLFPNAIRTDLEDRNAGPRSDWVRQIEDDHDLIVRHGDTPSTYCWQVADTEGNDFWYGGTPDGNGGCARDDSAILTADSASGVDDGVAGDYHWALTYVEDISGNTMRYSYDELSNVPIGVQSTGAGVSLYLREILYTGFSGAADDHPAYRVTFLRDGDVTGDRASRCDRRRQRGPAGRHPRPSAWRRGRIPRSRIPHLGRIGGSGQGLDARVRERPVRQVAADPRRPVRHGRPGTEHAWHEFEWYDEITDGAGNYTASVRSSSGGPKPAPT